MVGAIADAIAERMFAVAGSNERGGTPAARYRMRLMVARVWWSCFCAALWLFMFLSPAVSADQMRPVTMTIACLWALGFARNGAKAAARRMRRHAAFKAAVREEL